MVETKPIRRRCARLAPTSHGHPSAGFQPSAPPDKTPGFSPGKTPERCRYCTSKRITHKGVRHKKLETVQLWHCASCGRVFTPAPAELHNKTYPLPLILDGVTNYNLGSSLAEASAKLQARYGRRVPSSTLSTWILSNRELATYGRIRKEGRLLASPSQTIRAYELYHRQVYRFAYHRPKSVLLRTSRQHARFAPLVEFLEHVPQACPHNLFTDSSRASQAAEDFLDLSHAVITEKENYATRLAALVLPTVGDNYQRHDRLQRFMLANDSVTLAVEVPIWLTPEEIDAIEAERGIQLLPPDAERRVITGHIDFIQVRTGAVHILDYKPDVRTNKPITQLAIYAIALAHRTGLDLFDIKCAWFNEETYYEFFPGKALSHSSGRDRL